MTTTFSNVCGELWKNLPREGYQKRLRHFDWFIHRGFAIAFLRRQAFNKMSLGFFTMSHKRPSTAHCLGHSAQGWSFSVIIKGVGSYTEDRLYDYHKGISIEKFRLVLKIYSRTMTWISILVRKTRFKWFLESKTC